MDYLTCEQVADIAKCSVFHVREAVKSGELTAYKPAKCYLFTPEDVDAWIKNKKSSVIASRRANIGTREAEVKA